MIEIEAQPKDYLIFRLDEREWHRELACESNLEAEAIGFAELIAPTERTDGIRYEVHLLRATWSGCGRPPRKAPAREPITGPARAAGDAAAPSLADDPPQIMR